jgi:hypothetical protein
MMTKGSDEGGHVGAAFEPPEAAFGVDHSGGDPPFDHRAISPALDVAGGVSAD